MCAAMHPSCLSLSSDAMFARNRREEGKTCYSKLAQQCTYFVCRRQLQYLLKILTCELDSSAPKAELAQNFTEARS